MKKQAAVIAALCVFLASGNTYGASEYFDAGKGHWAYAAITSMSEKGVIAGYPDGSFRPAQIVTYGEFIKMAHIAENGKDIGGAKSGNWAESYYDASLEAGYFNRYDINRQQLSQEIPRRDMALIISALLDGEAVSDYDAIADRIADIDAKTDKQFEIVTAYRAGILTGYEDGTFRPSATLTRAEAAAVIQRLADKNSRILPEKTETGKVGDVIKNIKNFRNPGDGSVNQWLAEAETYSIAPDPAVFGFEIYYFADGEAGAKMTNPPPGQLYLVKDGIIVRWLDGKPLSRAGDIGVASVAELAGGDYIAALEDKFLLLIANPYK